jgi:hypothetical protein
MICSLGGLRAALRPPLHGPRTTIARQNIKDNGGIIDTEDP